MTLEQVMDLLSSHEDPRRLVPQLYGVAAWIASMRHDVFNYIIKEDPEVLLQSDLATFNAEDKAALIDTLLKQYDNGKLLDIDWVTYGMHRKLNQPRLADQLKPYICDKTKNEIVRRVAISVAEACELYKLQEDLAHVALDPSQSLHIRARAANSVCVVGDDGIKAMLKPLAFGEAGADPDDELKGYGLRALWPDNIRAEELFPLLTPPKKNFSLGTYYMFLSYELAKDLKLSDLSIALKWVKNLKRSAHPGNSFDSLIDNIMQKAWENLGYPNIMNDFAEVLAFRLKDENGFSLSYETDSEFRNALSKDDEKRRLVLESILPSIPHIDSIGDLVYSSPPLISNKDFYWAIEHVKSFECTIMKSYWARLIKYIFDINDVNQVESILLACKRNIELFEEFAENIRGIEIKSPEADRLRERYQRRQEHLIEKKQKYLLDPSPAQRIVKLLDDFEGGNYAAWWRLNMDLTLELDSERFGNEFEPDLTALPGWKSADTATKNRIIQAAKKYLFEQDPETITWIGQNVFHRPAFAGYRALRLLQKEAPSDISILPQSMWEKWAPSILSYPLSSSRDESAHRNLVRIAYQHAPEEIIETLMVLIDKENKEHGQIFVIREIEYCWDERLSAGLLKKAKEKGLKPSCMGTLLNNLLDNKAKGAKEFAESLFPSRETLSSDEQSKAVIAASALMTHADDAGWSKVWSAIQRDPEFGEKVIASALQNHYVITRKGLNLNESQLADLYIWLVRQYPHKEDPQHEGVFTPEARDTIIDFRDSILNQLKLMGKIEACEEIRRIAKELPDLELLKWVLYESQIITRQKMWKPLPPEKIIELATADRLHRSFGIPGYPEGTNQEDNSRFSDLESLNRSLAED